MNTSCSIKSQQNSGIYCILNTINNKFYIGSTKNTIRRRWLKHINDLKNNKHSNLHLQYSYNKYTIDAFKFIILEIINFTTIEHLLNREQYWMDITNCSKSGYNVHSKAMCLNNNYVVSKETKQKLKNCNIGKPRPEWMKIQYGKPILKYDKNMNFIEEYYSLAEAARINNVYRTNIKDVAMGKYKTCGGFIWKYK